MDDDGLTMEALAGVIAEIETENDELRLEIEALDCSRERARAALREVRLVLIRTRAEVLTVRRERDEARARIGELEASGDEDPAADSEVSIGERLEASECYGKDAE